MADWDDNGDFDEKDEFEEEDDGFNRYGWNYYSANQPRKVTSGIKTKSERGAIGNTWWSKRWVNVLESLGMGTRLTRGRSYARMGQVLSIEIEPGVVNARVQGSMRTPYKITIQMQPLSDEAWARVMDALSAQALFAAKLLAGEMPNTIEEVFQSVHVPLFPTTSKDLRTSCSCPDWANPCKHVAAVYYILAEQFDDDPFLLFKLRGRGRDAVITMLREKRAALARESSVPALLQTAQELVPPQAALNLEAHLSTFWQAGDGLEHFVVRPQPPSTQYAVLKRLGKAPFEIHGQNMATLLERAYEVIDRAVTRKNDELDQQ